MNEDDVMDAWDVRTLFVVVGLVIGLLYGLVAQATRFCVRRGVTDLAEGRGGETLTGWLGALLIAVPMTQWMMLDGHLSQEGMVYFPASLSLVTTLIGAVLFGTGMILTRGCPARLLVLAGSGNLRAWFGLLVIGVTAYATFRGLFAQTRVDLQAMGAVSLPQTSVFMWVEDATVPLLIVATVILGFFALRHGLNRSLIGGLAVGVLVAGAWSTTSVIGADDFDPMPAMSLSFVAPIGEAMTYMQLASGLEPSFNVTLVLGVLVGSALMAMVRGEWALQTFENAADHARYFLGAALMGIGGILALGCNTGQAITGLSTGSLWSVIVSAVILVTGFWAHRLIVMRGAS